jgi:hypothetical protein
MRRSVLAFAAAFGLACGSDSTTEPDANLPGTWNLTTVNDAALPFTLPGSGPDLTIEITGDQIVAYGDKTWIGATTYRRTEGGGITTLTQVPSGTWNQTGVNVTLNYAGGAIARATISGDVITFSAPGIVAVYARD